MNNLPRFTAKLLTTALSLLGLLSCGCLTEIYQQAQNAAQRKETFNELKQLGVAFHNFHDANRRGPKDWQDFGQFLPAGLQQTLESQGYQFVFNVAITEMRIGASNFVIAYPRDAETSGGTVLMGDASVHQLTADEFKQKLADQNADLAQQRAPSPKPAATASETPPATASPDNARDAQSAPPPATVAGAFKQGDHVFTQYAGSWEPVEILEVLPGGQYKIRWTKWGPQWDEVVPAARLAATAPANSRSRAQSRPPEPASPSEPFAPPEPFSPPAPFGGSPTPGFGAGSDPGTPIDDTTPLAPGDKVLAQWAGKWIPAEVLGLRGRAFVIVRLESDGFGGKLPVDPTLPRQLLRRPTGAESESAAAPPATGTPAAAAPAAAAQPPGAGSAAAEFRTWTDASGKFQIEARLIATSDGAVTLEKRDGVRIRMPLDKLSEKDRDFASQPTRPTE